MGLISFRRDRGIHWLGLAALALMMRIVSPAGFMVAPSHGFNLVICTGHGAISEDARNKSPSSPIKSSEHVCAFAGGLALNAPPPVVIPQQISVWPTYVPRIARAFLAPGQGLAAPPPPSHAPPPSFLI